jgi:hypothetical protein
MRLEDCCTHCDICGRSFCRDENPTPTDHTCPDCHQETPC